MSSTLRWRGSGERRDPLRSTEIAGNGYAGTGIAHQRREPLSGLVTLALLAILGAFIVTRIMRRIGLSMSRNSTFGFMFAFVVLVLMLWGQSFRK
jgi:uncharacterized membrane protein YeaQ/YmgE (transglycosylase-associated protein family)